MDSKLISSHQIDKLCQDAKASVRQRKNYNYHPVPTDLINRMLNAFELGTYCQPHKHEKPDKREVFIVLKGKLGVIIFNDHGTVIEGVVLEPYPGNPGIEIPPGTWHTVVALESGTVVYEIKDGPYDPSTDKKWASWAPSEGDEISNNYLKKIMIEAGF